VEELERVGQIVAAPGEALRGRRVLREEFAEAGLR